MTGPPLDPRLHAWSPEVADVRLRGRVEAAQYVEGTLRRIVAPSAPLRVKPGVDAPYGSELIFGEVVRAFDDTEKGWSFVQNRTDRYVGFVRSDALGVLAPEPSHRVAALRTFV